MSGTSISSKSRLHLHLARTFASLSSTPSLAYHVKRARSPTGVPRSGGRSRQVVKEIGAELPGYHVRDLESVRNARVQMLPEQSVERAEEYKKEKLAYTSQHENKVFPFLTSSQLERIAFLLLHMYVAERRVQVLKNNQCVPFSEIQTKTVSEANAQEQIQFPVRKSRGGKSVVLTSPTNNDEQLEKERAFLLRNETNLKNSVYGLTQNVYRMRYNEKKRTEREMEEKNDRLLKEKQLGLLTSAERLENIKANLFSYSDHTSFSSNNMRTTVPEETSNMNNMNNNSNNSNNTSKNIVSEIIEDINLFKSKALDNTSINALDNTSTNTKKNNNIYNTIKQNKVDATINIDLFGMDTDTSSNLIDPLYEDYTLPTELTYNMSEADTYTEVTRIKRQHTESKLQPTKKPRTFIPRDAFETEQVIQDSKKKQGKWLQFLQSTEAINRNTIEPEYTDLPLHTEDIRYTMEQPQDELYHFLSSVSSLSKDSSLTKELLRSVADEQVASGQSPLHSSEWHMADEQKEVLKREFSEDSNEGSFLSMKVKNKVEKVYSRHKRQHVPEDVMHSKLEEISHRQLGKAKATVQSFDKLRSIRTREQQSREQQHFHTVMSHILVNPAIPQQLEQLTSQTVSPASLLGLVIKQAKEDNKRKLQVTRTKKNKEESIYNQSSKRSMSTYASRDTESNDTHVTLHEGESLLQMDIPMHAMVEDNTTIHMSEQYQELYSTLYLAPQRFETREERTEWLKIGEEVGLLVKNEKFEEAIQYVQRKNLDRSPGAIGSYNQIVGGLLKHNMVDNALLLVQTCEEHGVLPNTVTYNQLLNFYVKRNQSQHITQILSLMSENNILPDSVTYNILLNWRKREGDYLTVRSIGQKMRLQGVGLNSSSCGKLIWSFVRDNNLAAALQVLHFMYVEEDRRQSLRDSSNQLSQFLQKLKNERQTLRVGDASGWLHSCGEVYDLQSWLSSIEPDIFVYTTLSRGVLHDMTSVREGYTTCLENVSLLQEKLNNMTFHPSQVASFIEAYDKELAQMRVFADLYVQCLNTLLGFLQYCRQEIKPELTPSRVKLLGDLCRNVIRACQMVSTPSTHVVAHRVMSIAKEEFGVILGAIDEHLVGGENTLQLVQFEEFIEELKLQRVSVADVKTSEHAVYYVLKHRKGGIHFVQIVGDLHDSVKQTDAGVKQSIKQSELASEVKQLGKVLSSKRKHNHMQKEYVSLINIDEQVDEDIAVTDAGKQDMFAVLPMKQAEEEISNDTSQSLTPQKQGYNQNTVYNSIQEHLAHASVVPKSPNQHGTVYFNQYARPVDICSPPLLGVMANQDITVLHSNSRSRNTLAKFVCMLPQPVNVGKPINIFPAAPQCNLYEVPSPSMASLNQPRAPVDHPTTRIYNIQRVSPYETMNVITQLFHSAVERSQQGLALIDTIPLSPHADAVDTESTRDDPLHARSFLEHLVTTLTFVTNGVIRGHVSTNVQAVDEHTSYVSATHQRVHDVMLYIDDTINMNRPVGEAFERSKVLLRNSGINSAVLTAILDGISKLQTILHIQAERRIERHMVNTNEETERSEYEQAQDADRVVLDKFRADPKYLSSAGSVGLGGREMMLLKLFQAFSRRWAVQQKGDPEEQKKVLAQIDGIKQVLYGSLSSVKPKVNKKIILDVVLPPVFLAQLVKLQQLLEMTEDSPADIRDLTAAYAIAFTSAVPAQTELALRIGGISTVDKPTLPSVPSKGPLSIYDSVWNNDKSTDAAMYKTDISTLFAWSDSFKYDPINNVFTCTVQKTTLSTPELNTQPKTDVLLALLKKFTASNKLTEAGYIASIVDIMLFKDTLQIIQQYPAQTDIHYILSSTPVQFEIYNMQLFEHCLTVWLTTYKYSRFVSFLDTVQLRFGCSYLDAKIMNMVLKCCGNAASMALDAEKKSAHVDTTLHAILGTEAMLSDITTTTEVQIWSSTYYAWKALQYTNMYIQECARKCVVPNNDIISRAIRLGVRYGLEEAAVLMLAGLSPAVSKPQITAKDKLVSGIKEDRTIIEIMRKQQKEDSEGDIWASLAAQQQQKFASSVFSAVAQSGASFAQLGDRNLQELGLHLGSAWIFCAREVLFLLKRGSMPSMGYYRDAELMKEMECIVQTSTYHNISSNEVEDQRGILALKQVIDGTNEELNGTPGTLAGRDMHTSKMNTKALRSALRWVLWAWKQGLYKGVGLLPRPVAVNDWLSVLLRSWQDLLLGTDTSSVYGSKSAKVLLQEQFQQMELNTTDSITTSSITQAEIDSLLSSPLDLPRVEKIVTDRPSSKHMQLLNYTNQETQHTEQGAVMLQHFLEACNTLPYVYNTHAIQDYAKQHMQQLEQHDRFTRVTSVDEHVRKHGSYSEIDMFFPAIETALDVWRTVDKPWSVATILQLLKMQLNTLNELRSMLQSTGLYDVVFDENTPNKEQQQHLLHTCQTSLEKLLYKPIRAVRDQMSLFLNVIAQEGYVPTSLFNEAVTKDTLYTIKQTQATQRTDSAELKTKTVQYNAATQVFLTPQEAAQLQEMFVRVSLGLNYLKRMLGSHRKSKHSRQVKKLTE